MPDPAPLELSVVPMPLREQMEAKLRQAIIQGHFAPGTHLPVQMLCDAFGVSRPVVREAMRLLTAEGLIEDFPNRGAFVKTMSVAEAQQFHAVRGVLEALAAKSFAEHASDAQIGKIAEVVAEIRAAAPAADGGHILGLKQKYYGILFEGAGNDYLAEILTQILNRNMLLRATSLSMPGRAVRTVAELEALVAALKARDPEAAWQASLDHASAAAEAAITILKERESGGG